MPWTWANNTIPVWVLPTTATTSARSVMTVWWSEAGTSTAWSTAATTYTSTQQAQVLQQMHTQATTSPAYERYLLHRDLSGLGQLFMPSRPAILTHQEEARRDRELYRRAVAEHDEQEQARILRVIQAREATAEQQRLAMEAQREMARQQQVAHAAAKTRARELLIEHLTPAQRETFDAHGWFIVEGGRSKKKYRIRAVEHMAGNVDVLRFDNRTLHRLCAHIPVGQVPLGDQLLAQKIMLELAEDDFLRTANRHAA